MARADSTADSAAAGTAVQAGDRDRILTVPNAISVARLAGVPVFLWLVLGPQADGWAVALLILAGLSDWLLYAIVACLLLIAAAAFAFTTWYP